MQCVHLVNQNALWAKEHTFINGRVPVLAYGIEGPAPEHQLQWIVSALVQITYTHHIVGPMVQSNYSHTSKHTL